MPAEAEARERWDDADDDDDSSNRLALIRADVCNIASRKLVEGVAADDSGTYDEDETAECACELKDDGKDEDGDDCCNRAPNQAPTTRAQNTVGDATGIDTRD